LFRNIVKPIILEGSRSTDATGTVDRRYVEGKPEMEAILDEEREEAEVARLVYELRSRAGLTQKELAARVGTTPSVISRLEDANYGRHSLSMLRRIAAAVGQRVEIRFVPVDLAGPHRVASRPGGERRPDPPIPAQEICAPVDLPRLGKAVRCQAREGLHRLPDPYIPE
jgi:transcriptional regulator with XRE-family HTH domain